MERIAATSRCAIAVSSAVLLTASVSTEASAAQPQSQLTPQAQSSTVAQEQAESEETGQQGQGEGAQVQTSTFIFVEGSLPFVPDANTIVAKLPLSMSQTPFNVGVLTRALFEAQGGLILGQALKNVSGVNIEDGFGITDYFVLRGFDALSSSLVLIDGAPELEATFYDLYNVEVVEVLKGPGGFLYGSNPLAGAVNLVRKQPLPTMMAGVSARTGSDNSGSASFDLNHGSPGDSIFFRVNGLWRQEGTFRDFKGGRSFAFNPAFTWQLDEEASLHVSAEYVSADYKPESGIPLVDDELLDVPRERDYQTPFDASNQDIFRGQIDYERRFSANASVRNKTWFRSLNWVSESTLFIGDISFKGFPEAFDPIILLTRVGLDDNQQMWGNQTEALLEFDTGPVHHSMLVGVEFSRYADRFSFGFSPTTIYQFLFKPVPREYFEFVGVPPIVTSQTGNSRTIVSAPYVVDQVTVSDSFQLLAGVRYDSIDFEDTASGTDRNDSEPSPMLGFAFAPMGNLTVYGHYSRSFAPPSVRVVGEQLPEQSRQFEAGVKLNFLDGAGRLTLAAYDLERENIAIPNQFGFLQETGSQRSRGFEVEFAGEFESGLRGIVSYAYNDPELTKFSEFFTAVRAGAVWACICDRTGNRPAFAPEHLANAWLSKTFDSGLGIGAGLRHVGSQFISEENGFSIDAYTTVQAAVSYDHHDWRLHFTAYNLTNTEYLTRAFGDFAVTPAEPLSLVAGFDLRF